MTIIDTDLEKACKFLLKKHISFEIKNKVYKKGTLQIFYQKNFYIIFIIDTLTKKRDRVEIPIPFGVELHLSDNLIYFDYRLSSIIKFCPELESFFKLYPKTSNNKYYDNILTINTNES